MRTEFLKVPYYLFNSVPIWLAQFGLKSDIPDKITAATRQVAAGYSHKLQHCQRADLRAAREWRAASRTSVASDFDTLKPHTTRIPSSHYRIPALCPRVVLCGYPLPTGNEISLLAPTLAIIYKIFLKIKIFKESILLNVTINLVLHFVELFVNWSIL